MKTVHRWPWGVVPMTRRSKKVCTFGVPLVRVWYAWCDCGWSCTRTWQRQADSELRKHRHMTKKGSA